MSKDPKKYDLNAQEIQYVNEAYRVYGNSDLETDKLFELFQEWQSSKTRSLKRFVLSLSFILTLSWIIDIDLTKIKPLGINDFGSNETYFLLTLLTIHIGAFIYYMIERSIDLNIRKAKMSLIVEDLVEYVRISDRIENIIKEREIPSFEALLRDVKGTIHQRRLTNSHKVFYAITFFKEKLVKERNKRFWAEKVEIILIGLLALAGFWSIIRIIFKL